MTHLSSTTDRISVLTERVLGPSLSQIPEAIRADLLKRISALVEEEVQRERERCVRICRKRSDLWHRTLAERRFRLQTAGVLVLLLVLQAAQCAFLQESGVVLPWSWLAEAAN